MDLQLVQGYYAVARVRFEPATIRLHGKRPTTRPNPSVPRNQQRFNTLLIFMLVHWIDSVNNSLFLVLQMPRPKCTAKKSLIIFTVVHFYWPVNICIVQRLFYYGKICHFQLIVFLKYQCRIGVSLTLPLMYQGNRNHNIQQNCTALINLKLNLTVQPMHEAWLC